MASDPEREAREAWVPVKRTSKGLFAFCTPVQTDNPLPGSVRDEDWAGFAERWNEFTETHPIGGSTFGVILLSAFLSGGFVVAGVLGGFVNPSLFVLIALAFPALWLMLYLGMVAPAKRYAREVDEFLDNETDCLRHTEIVFSRGQYIRYTGCAAGYQPEQILQFIKATLPFGRTVPTLPLSPHIYAAMMRVPKGRAWLIEHGYHVGFRVVGRRRHLELQANPKGEKVVCAACSRLIPDGNNCTQCGALLYKTCHECQKPIRVGEPNCTWCKADVSVDRPRSSSMVKAAPSAPAVYL